MILNDSLYVEIKRLIEQSRNSIARSVNWAMVMTHWEIGRRIVEEEQNGEKRAIFGKFLIKNLSEKLTEEFGQGFDARELRKMRQFYAYFPIRDAVRPELTWTHYRLLLRVEESVALSCYLRKGIWRWIFTPSIRVDAAVIFGFSNCEHTVFAIDLVAL